MARKEYLLGWAMGAVWVFLGIAVLYGLSLFIAPPASLAVLIACWAALWPLGVGFLAGWRRGEAGFAAGLGVFVPPGLFFGLLWWWLLPGLWSVSLCAKALLIGMALAAVAGGLGAGFKAAKLQLHLPPAEEGLE